MPIWFAAAGRVGWWYCVFSTGAMLLGTAALGFFLMAAFLPKGWLAVLPVITVCSLTFYLLKATLPDCEAGTDSPVAVLSSSR